MEATENVIDAAYAICNWINKNIVYEPLCTTVETTAAEVLERKKGVCQDFAHLMIAFCRHQAFPPATSTASSWAKAKPCLGGIFDGYNWLGFDPTHNCRISDGYVKLAHGRDARDCSVNRGLYTGLANQQTTIHVTLQEI